VPKWFNKFSSVAGLSVERTNMDGDSESTNESVSPRNSDLWVLGSRLRVTGVACWRREDSGNACCAPPRKIYKFLISKWRIYVRSELLSTVTYILQYAFDLTNLDLVFVPSCGW